MSNRLSVNAKETDALLPPPSEPAAAPLEGVVAHGLSVAPPLAEADDTHDEVAKQLDSPLLLVACIFNAICCALGGFFCFAFLFSGMLSSFFDLFDDVYRTREGRNYLASVASIVLSSTGAVLLLPYSAHYTRSVAAGKGAYDFRRRLAPRHEGACLWISDLISWAYYMLSIFGSFVYALACGSSSAPMTYVQYAVIWNALLHVAIVALLAVIDLAMWGVSAVVYTLGACRGSVARNFFETTAKYKFEVRTSYEVSPARQARCFGIPQRKSLMFGLIFLVFCDLILFAAALYFAIAQSVNQFVMPIAILVFIFDLALDMHLKNYESPPFNVRVVHHVTRGLMIAISLIALVASVRTNDGHTGVEALSACICVYVLINTVIHELLLLRFDDLWPIFKQRSRTWYFQVNKLMLLSAVGIVFVAAGFGLLQILGTIDHSKKGTIAFVVVCGFILLGIGIVCLGTLVARIIIHIKKFVSGKEDDEPNPFDKVFILTQQIGLVVTIAAFIFVVFALFIMVFLNTATTTDSTSVAIANASLPIIATLPQLPICQWGFTNQSVSIVDIGFMIDIAYYPEDIAREMLKTWFGDSWKMVVPEELNISTEYAQWYEFQKNGTCILAIRGTSTDFDVLRDADIWLQSLLVRILQMFVPGFSLLPSSLSRSFVKLSTWPWRDQSYHYESFIEYIDKYPCEDRIVVGHSLGGGLAQIVSTLKKVRSVTFSPPGALYSSVKLGLGDDTTLMRLSHFLVSVIPDSDVVPMVDSQRGHIVTIPCHAGDFISCHSCERTACYLMYSCGDPLGRTFSDFDCHSATGQSSSSHTDRTTSL